MYFLFFGIMLSGILTILNYICNAYSSLKETGITYGHIAVIVFILLVFMR